MTWDSKNGFLGFLCCFSPAPRIRLPESLCLFEALWAVFQQPLKNISRTASQNDRCLNNYLLWTTPWKVLFPFYHSLWCTMLMLFLQPLGSRMTRCNVLSLQQSGPEALGREDFPQTAQSYLMCVHEELGVPVLTGSARNQWLVALVALPWFGTILRPSYSPEFLCRITLKLSSVELWDWVFSRQRHK